MDRVPVRLAALLLLAPLLLGSQVTPRLLPASSDGDVTCDVASFTNSEATVLTLPTFDNSGKQSNLNVSVAFECAAASVVTFNLKESASTVETWTFQCVLNADAMVSLAWRDTANSSGRAWTVTAQAASAGTHTLNACAITRSSNPS